MMRVNLVCFHMPQHAKHSGYSQLVRCFNGQKFDLEDDKSFLRLIPPSFKKKFIGNSELAWFTEDRLATELYVILNMLIKREEIFHFIYGENSYRYSGWFSKLRGNKIICTFHTPPEIFSDKVRSTNHLHRLDAITVVASSQIDFFAKFVPKERIFFVPHGIDTEFFHPSAKKQKDSNKICLFVGHFLRDFDTLRAVIRIMNLRSNQIKHTVITWKRNFVHFEVLKNITLRTGLNDKELLRYYQNATVLLQPMENCTANNSVLEGLACGLPIVATDVGGIRDYVDESCAILVPPHEPEMMAEEVIGLLEDRSRLEKMSDNSRKRALEFSWPKIAEKMKDVYKEILGR